MSTRLKSAARFTRFCIALYALSCGARTDIPCGEAPALSGGCADDDRDEEEENPCDRSLREAPPCQGEGLVWSSPDECIDDGGSSGTGDRLEVYCVGGIARLCLSLEDCPWRTGVTTSDALTCSVSGLQSTYMANMIEGCAGWEGSGLYCCSSEGRLGLADASGL